MNKDTLNKKGEKDEYIHMLNDVNGEITSTLKTSIHSNIKK